jgi:hypothetical protein
MKTIQTKAGEVLLIRVPEDATDFKISGTNYLCFLIEDNWEAEVPRLQDKFEILDKFSQLEDKDLEEFVHFEDLGYPNGWEDYYSKFCTAGSEYCLNTAKESFQSLCKSQGIEDDLDNYLIIKKI